MDFISTPLFLSWSLSFIHSSINSCPLWLQWLSLEGYTVLGFACEGKRPVKRWAGWFGSSPREELSDVHLCSKSSHHVGQVHSSHHFGMLPFPVLPGTHRDGQGFCPWLTSVQLVQSLSRVPLVATPRICSTPGFPEHHQLLGLTETHVQ